MILQARMFGRQVINLVDDTFRVALQFIHSFRTIIGADSLLQF